MSASAVSMNSISSCNAGSKPAMTCAFIPIPLEIGHYLVLFGLYCVEARRVNLGSPSSSLEYVRSSRVLL